jgi:hypothetical protein
MPNPIIKRLQLNNIPILKAQYPGVHEDLQKTQTRINQLTTVLEAVAAATNIDIKKLLGSTE